MRDPSYNKLLFNIYTASLDERTVLGCAVNDTNVLNTLLGGVSHNN